MVARFSIGLANGFDADVEEGSKLHEFVHDVPDPNRAVVGGTEGVPSIHKRSRRDREAAA